MNRFKKFLFLLLALLTVAISAHYTLADFGDFNDYSDDSGGSWGGGGGWDSDYDSYDSGSYSSSSSSGEGSPVALIIVVIIVLWVVLSDRKKKKDGTGTSHIVRQGANINVPDHTAQIAEAVSKNDPNFSADKFVANAKDVFMSLQEAWTNRDLEKVRPMVKEEMYAQHEAQVRKMIEGHRINVLDRINISQAYLYNYTIDNEYEQIGVYIMARMKDYYVNEDTKEVIQGDPNAEYYLKYIYTFMRKRGVTTEGAVSSNNTVACPNCGAPTTITSSGKCEYCGFIITTGNFNWVLSDITGIKQSSNLGPGGVIDRTTQV